ncbi:Venom allergen 5 [Schistosoma japonicum]|nr:Venom allergen 5 [Schistosoma japonicum]
MKFIQLLILFVYTVFQTIINGKLTPDLQKLLDLHNQVRRSLTACTFDRQQPPAKHLPDLIWDDELAAKAKDLANECYFHHNDVDLKHKWEYVGQNIAGYQTIDLAFDSWLSEYKMYHFYSTSCSGVCGHYTQLVWQNTTHVGCGVTNCTGYYGFPYGLSVVCNYGPGGNYEGRQPYETKTEEECHAVTTMRPTTRPRTTRRPGTPKKLPKPDWTTLIPTWRDFATSNHLTGIVTQTCICID